MEETDIARIRTSCRNFELEQLDAFAVAVAVAVAVVIVAVLLDMSR